MSTLAWEPGSFFIRSSHYPCAFERANEYALRKLERELPSHLRYHCLAHTKDDVVPAVERFAALEGVRNESLELVRTAAYYHDIGFIRQIHNHEETSARIAQTTLPGFGFNPHQVAQVVNMIQATQIPQSPHNLLEAILADADLDLLGRADFWTRNQALREELFAAGCFITDVYWYTNQLHFLTQHSYFTNAARLLRGPRKQQHLAEMAERLTCAQHTAI